MDDYLASGHGSLLDLTSHQRNLLLIRPVLKLDFNKLMYTREDGSYLLEGIDTNYLCLAALYFMTARLHIRRGARSSEDACGVDVANPG